MCNNFQDDMVYSYIICLDRYMHNTGIKGLILINDAIRGVRYKYLSWHGTTRISYKKMKHNKTITLINSKLKIKGMQEPAKLIGKQLDTLKLSGNTVRDVFYVRSGVFFLLEAEWYSSLQAAWAVDSFF